MVPEREATSMSNQFAVDIPAGVFIRREHTNVKVILYYYE